MFKVFKIVSSPTNKIYRVLVGQFAKLSPLIYRIALQFIRRKMIVERLVLFLNIFFGGEGKSINSINSISENVSFVLIELICGGGWPVGFVRRWLGGVLQWGWASSR